MSKDKKSAQDLGKSDPNDSGRLAKTTKSVADLISIEVALLRSALSVGFNHFVLGIGLLLIAVSALSAALLFIANSAVWAIAALGVSHTVSSLTVGFVLFALAAVFIVIGTSFLKRVGRTLAGQIENLKEDVNIMKAAINDE